MSEVELIQKVAAKAVIESEGGILILHPSSIDANRNWHHPGGIRDNIQEPIGHTLVRETFEEIGTDLTDVPAKVIHVGEWPATDNGQKVKILGIFFHLVLPRRPDIKLSEEHDEFAWVNLANYRSYNANNEVYILTEHILRVN